jgi:hypothetical protein
LTEAPDLSSRFREIIARGPTMAAETEDHECVSMLLETNWTRIFVVQEMENPEHIRIEVEVSQPSQVQDESSESGFACKKRPLRQLLEQLILHIEYILKLESSGFIIDYVGNDFLILAFQSFTKLPSTEVFELLLPPV